MRCFFIYVIIQAEIQNQRDANDTDRKQPLNQRKLRKTRI